MCVCCAVGNPRLDEMLRSLVVRHHPQTLLDAVTAGDVDTVTTILAHVPLQPDVC